MKIPRLSDVLAAVIIAVLFAVCGWYLVQHPEVALFDAVQQQQHRGQ